MRSWRDCFLPIIARTLAEHADASEKEQRAALRMAYTALRLGRSHHPYKVWLDECNRQLHGRPWPAEPKPKPDTPGQGMLWQGDENR